MNCERSGCGGHIVDGYCDDCGLAPAAKRSGPETEVIRVHRPAGLAWPAPEPAVAARATTTSTRSTSGTHRRLGAGLVPVPAVTIVDPEAAVLSNPQVAEHRRFCTRCDQPVGRSRDGQPGRTEGFCRKCRKPFSFEPKLSSGDVVGGQYEVVGCLAHGGLGWIYLARDRNVSVSGVVRHVVLKGLLDSADEDAMDAALAERRFLAEVEHPNIVKIYNFVEHDDCGYIVMEFVNGVSLRAMLEERRHENGGAADPLPVGEAITYCLEVLPALGHLHDLGLLFCDFKPDNVIRTERSLKLIDLGGVFRMGDETSKLWGTDGYQAPEIRDVGPTVSSDLFTVARTLAVLCTDFAGYQSTYKYSLPAQVQVPVYARFDSLYRFLERATATDPAERFQSAAEMAGQLDGILREVVAAEPDAKPAPRPSLIFTPEGRGAVDAPDAHLLPSPLVDPDDPHAGLILSLSAADPDEIVEHVATIGEPSVELQLWLVRALITLGRFPEAIALLATIDDGDPREWRTDWYRGVVGLLTDDPAGASASFDHVYRWLPGELAPKLGLAMSAERRGDHAGAARWYEIVARTDPSFTSAVFGLARSRFRLGDVSGAVAAYDDVPHTSSAYVEARTSVVGVLLAGDGVATLDQVITAGRIVESLSLDRELRGRLSVQVLETALVALAAPTAPPTAGELFGRPVTEREVRLGLEQAYRSLARTATSAGERIELVDRANQVRPRSWL